MKRISNFYGAFCDIFEGVSDLFAGSPTGFGVDAYMKELDRYRKSIEGQVSIGINVWPNRYWHYSPYFHGKPKGKSNEA